MSSSKPLSKPLFWCHIAYVVALGILVLKQHRLLWLIGVAIYVVPIISYVLFYWLPKRLKATKEHGRPSLPIGPDSIGSRYSDLALNESFVLSRTGRSSRSKRTHHLYEGDLTNDHGTWHYWIETTDGVVVAFDFNFESSKSKFLSYSSGWGSGRFLHCDS